MSTHPTATIMKNINMDKEFNYTFKKFGTQVGEFVKIKIGNNSAYETSHYSNVYGNMSYGKIIINIKPSAKLNIIYSNNGIKILGMTPSSKTSDGKFKYEGISIKELKVYCKENCLKKSKKQ